MNLKKIKDAISVLLGNHKVFQKLNYLKFVFSKPRLMLNYNPAILSIVATGRCNLRCDMCPTHSKKIPDAFPYKQTTTRDIDIDTFKMAVDKFHTALEVNIIGSGEPLLNGDLFKMAEYATRIRKMRTKTFTNGLILKQKAREIVNSYLDGITVSINGHDAGEFERMTGMSREYYDRIYEGIEELIRLRNAENKKLKIKLAFIIDRKNYKYIGDMIDMSCRLGVDHTYFCNFLPSPCAGFTVSERVLTTDDADAIRAIKDVYKNLTSEFKRRITLPYILDRNARQKKCKTHFSQIRIDGEGNVNSCSVMLLNMSGHGKFQDADVWNNGFFRAMRNKFLDEEAKLDEPCTVCVENYGCYPW